MKKSNKELQSLDKFKSRDSSIVHQSYKTQQATNNQFPSASKTYSSFYATKQGFSKSPGTIRNIHKGSSKKQILLLEECLSFNTQSFLKQQLTRTDTSNFSQQHLKVTTDSLEDQGSAFEQIQHTPLQSQNTKIKKENQSLEAQSHQLTKLEREKWINQRSIKKDLQKGFAIKKQESDEALETLSQIFDCWIVDFQRKNLADQMSAASLPERSLIDNIMTIAEDFKDKLPLDFLIYKMLQIGLAPDFQTLEVIILNSLPQGKKQTPQEKVIINKQQLMRIFNVSLNGKLEEILACIQDQITKVKNDQKMKLSYKRLNLEADPLSQLFQNTQKQKSENWQRRKLISPEKRSTIGNLSNTIANKIVDAEAIRAGMLLDQSNDPGNETGKIMNFIKIFSIQRKRRQNFNHPGKDQRSRIPIQIYIDDPEEHMVPKKLISKEETQKKQEQEFFSRLKMVNKYYYQRQRIKKEIKGLKKQIIYEELVNVIKKLNSLLIQFEKIDFIQNGSKEQLDARKVIQDALVLNIKCIKEKYGVEARNIILTIISSIPPVEIQSSAQFEEEPVLGLIQILITILTQKQYEQEKKTQVFPNEGIIEMFQVVEQWWNELDPLKLQSVSKVNFQCFLRDKGIIKDPKQAESLLRAFFAEYNSMKADSIKKSMFMRVMSCAIMKGILGNLQKHVKNQNSFGKLNISLSLRILKLQRMILINGVSNNQQQSQICKQIVDGLQTLSKQQFEQNFDFRVEKAKVEQDIKDLQQINQELKIDQRRDILFTGEKKLAKIQSSNSLEYCDLQDEDSQDENPALKSLDSEVLDEIQHNDTFDVSRSLMKRMQDCLVQMLIRSGGAELRKSLVPKLKSFLATQLQKRNQSSNGKRISLMQRQKISLLMNKSLIEQDSSDGDNIDLELANQKNFIYKKKALPRKLSNSSSSTASSSHSTYQGPLNKIGTLLKPATAPIIDCFPLEKMIMDINLSKKNSINLTPQCVSNQGSNGMNNLAVDCYQRLIGVTNKEGSVEILDFQGKRRMKICLKQFQLSSLYFFPNRPFLIGHTTESKIILVNYSTGDHTQVMLNLDDQESIVSLYIPQFISDMTGNDDYAYIGTSENRIIIVSLKARESVTQLSNLIQGDYIVSNIISNPKKPHRLVVTYRLRKDQLISTVLIYSLSKGKIQQRFDFKPTRYQELGQAVSSVVSPDNKRIAIQFESGKIQVFNMKSKKLLQKLEVDNEGYLSQAQLAWKNISDGRSCLLVSYSYKGNQKEEREVGIFFSKSKDALLDESHYFNHLASTSDSISHCALIDLMIDNQSENLRKLLQSDSLLTSKGSLLQRSSKDKFFKGVLILGLTQENKIHYCHPQLISKERNTAPTSFKALPFYVSFNSQTKAFHFLDLTKQTDQVKENFSKIIEEMVHTRRSEVILDVINEDLISQGNSKPNKGKFATMAEVESFLNNQVEELSQESLIGYTFTVTLDQELIIGRVEKSRTVKVMEYDLKPHIDNDQVTAIQADPLSTKIMLSMRKSGQCCELLLTQNIMKSSFLKNSVTTCIELCPIRVKDQDQDEDAKIVLMRFARTQNSQVLLILGFSNGRVKIINAKTQKVLMNIKALSDSSSISAIDFSLDEANLKIYCGTLSGHIFQITVNNKESKVVKGKQICLQAVKQMIASERDSLFVLAQRQVFQVEKQNFSVKNKFDLSNQKALGSKDQFSQFVLTDIDSKSKSLACLIPSQRWLVMLDVECMIPYCVYDIKNLDISILYALPQYEQTFLFFTQHQCQTIFALNKTLKLSESGEHEDKLNSQLLSMNNAFDIAISQQSFPSSDKKSTLVKLFTKKLTVQNAIEKNSKKQRSKSQGASKKELKQSSLPTTEVVSSLKQRMRDSSAIEQDQKMKGYAILLRNSKNCDVIEELDEEQQQSIVSRGNRVRALDLKRNQSSVQSRENSSKSIQRPLSGNSDIQLRSRRR